MILARITRTSLVYLAFTARLLSISQAARPDERAEAAMLPQDRDQASRHQQASSLLEAQALEMGSRGHMISHRDHEADASGDGDGDGSGGEAPQVDTANKGEKNEWEEAAAKPENEIARDKSKLSTLPEKYKAVQDAYEAAAKHVWENGDPDGTNKIQKTGLDWMNQAQDFRDTAGKMRKEAEDVYENIVKTHTKAAKTQMLAFKEEMFKLKHVHEAHEKIEKAAEAAETAAKTEDAGVEKKDKDRNIDLEHKLYKDVPIDPTQAGEWQNTGENAAKDPENAQGAAPNGGGAQQGKDDKEKEKDTE